MNIRNAFKNLLTPIVIILGLSSCLNDNDGAPIQPFAFVSIYHGAPETASLDVFANSSKVTNSPFRFTETLPYLRYYLGQRTFKFSPYNSVTTLLEDTFTIEDNKVYSIFLTGLPNDLEAIIVEDSWGSFNQNQTKIRFVHLSPDAGEVEILLDNEETSKFENNEFKSHSNFEALEAKSYNIKVVSKETGETLITANNVELKRNRAYSLILRGLESEQTDVNKQLNLQLITNFINY
ncbi:DUF4397 domain-containing protein [Belliella kenyensis]|uniref:DUF4397 domain-containing protein n=2 Tax=Belliella kenyensis TaxID=1472724 RepID=A0ABV8EK85_9BACT|nr:DUF4397 domain-containing protein [Belliella kenyensis]MCH7403071.1 DUF4397 domain-containing protein [Belliella kenyensis]MDN3602240.1 DUF4397 domain-containing protein [Belliella kenyensis]